MVANTPRMSSRAIKSFARIPSFSARSLTLMPSVMVMCRLIGNGSFETVSRGGGTKPFIGPSLPRAECSAVPAGAKALLGGCLDARDRAAVGLARLQVDAPPQVIAAWDASAAALR